MAAVTCWLLWDELPLEAGILLISVITMLIALTSLMVRTSMLEILGKEGSEQCKYDRSCGFGCILEDQKLKSNQIPPLAELISLRAVVVYIKAPQPWTFAWCFSSFSATSLFCPWCNYPSAFFTFTQYWSLITKWSSLVSNIHTDMVTEDILSQALVLQILLLNKEE